MMNQEDNVDITGVEYGEELLKQLFHLKRYETPELARMTRNKQNIMRRVREASSSRRRSLADLLEINFPWLFAEPRFGVALLFVAFAGLQFLGVNARNAAQSDTGIYTTSTDRFAMYERAAATATNADEYPALPSNTPLFPDQRNQGVVTWAAEWSK